MNCLFHYVDPVTIDVVPVGFFMCFRYFLLSLHTVLKFEFINIPDLSVQFYVLLFGPLTMSLQKLLRSY